jgi:endonuclease G, mitochondrial
MNKHLTFVKIFKMKKIFLFVFAVGLISSCTKKMDTPSIVIPDNENFLLGNPSKATKVETNADNYLLEKKQYVLSYNNTLGRSNWVSWRIGIENIGTVKRADDFRPDDKLPASFYKASSGSYTGSGFDRGHLCPSADRTDVDTNNSETFTMTNIIPQAPNMNQGNWADLENYSRDLVKKGNELYVIAGGTGEGGSGSNGGTTKRLDNGKLIVPSSCWKIIVVLENKSGNDVDRITKDTRIIAIEIPNKQSAGADSWKNYRLSVRDLETKLGYNFLSSLPQSMQDVIELNVDKTP